MARSLAQRLQEMPPATLAPLMVRHADAHQVPPEPIDRLHVGCVWPSLPAAWLTAVRPGGIIVAPIGEPDAAVIQCHRRVGDAWEQVDGPAVSFVPGLSGTVD